MPLVHHSFRGRGGGRRLRGKTRLPPLPTSLVRVLARAMVAVTVLTAALALVSVPLALEDHSTNLGPLARNTLTAFALALALETTPIRAVAWMPAVLWLGTGIVFLQPLGSIPVLGDLVAIRPQTGPAALVAATLMTVAAVALFALRGGGAPPFRLSRSRRRARPPRRGAYRATPSSDSLRDT